MQVADVLKTGDQIAAARVLAHLSQGELADRAGIHRNTVSMMEKRGAHLLVSGFDTVHKLMQVFQDAGVIFIDDGDDHGVGVMLATSAMAPMESAVAGRASKLKKVAKIAPAKKTRQRRP
jgi:transcriptional regulator with XRE-family HTH domain